MTGTWRDRWCGVLLWAIASGCAAEDGDDDTANTSPPGDTTAETTSATEESSGADTTATVDTSGATTTGEAQSCLDALDAARAFLGANRSCEMDADCTQVGTFCLPESTCGSSPIAVGYDMDEWMMISDGLNTCEDCGADPCGACTACEQGSCTLSVACGE